MSSSLSVDELRRLDREVVWHAFSQMSEYDGLIIDHAQGCWLYDVESRRYLDGVSSLWCNVHGHRHPVIDAAIQKQLGRVAHVTSLGQSHPTTIELADRLVQLAPKGLEHVFFSSDGSSAVEVALKLAFQYWRQCETPQPERTTYLAVGNSYHGDTLGSVAVGGVQRFHAMFHPLLFPVMRGPCPDLYRLPSHVTLENATSHYLDAYRRILEEHHHRLVAVIVEPLVQGAAGMVVHPQGFLRGLRDLCSQYDLFLIADEIAVGMGRTGTLFACEQEDVAPDLLCLGKGLSGGYLPMAATLASTRIWKAFLGEYAESKSFFHGHTYGGNPLGAAASLATLQIFDQEQTLRQVGDKAQFLAECLKPLKDHPFVGDIRQKGLVAAVELVENKPHKTPYPWSEKRGILACKAAMEKEVWLRPLGNVIPLIPPLSITLDEIRLMVDALAFGIDCATRSDLQPKVGLRSSL